MTTSLEPEEIAWEHELEPIGNDAAVLMGTLAARELEAMQCHAERRMGKRAKRSHDLWMKLGDYEFNPKA